MKKIITMTLFGSLMTNGFTILTDGDWSVRKPINMIFDNPVKKDIHIDKIRDYQHISTVPIGAGKYYFINLGKLEMSHLHDL